MGSSPTPGTFSLLECVGKSGKFFAVIYPPEVIERVRQASDIVEVISSYVPLKRTGSTFKALSPFKKEKTPSFNVNPARQIFKCFSSGHGGDVFKFVMLYENIDFPTAVQRLAEKAGIALPTKASSPKEEAGRAVRSKLLQLHAEVAAYWSELLAHDPRAEPARKYMHHREIPLTWIKDYGLGFAPEAWDDLLQWAAQRGYERSLVVEGGLAVSKESGGAYDRFRGRLMFPIRNDQGHILGFSGRVLDPESKEAKYVNSPETVLFKKSSILFGLERAKRPMLDADRAILCEGQIDVLRCHAAGIGNVVAPLGTSLTEEHCKLLKRHAATVVLCLDADSAGQNAARRAADLLLQDESGVARLAGAELGIEVVELPAGHDPDSIIVKEGPDAFRKLLDQPRSFLDFLMDWLERRHPRGDAGGVRRITEDLGRFLGQIPNVVLREQLKAQASVRLRVPPDVLEAELKRQVKRPPPRALVQPTDGEREAGGGGGNRPEVETVVVHPTIKAVLSLILVSPGLVPELQRRLDLVWIESLPGADLLSRVMELYNDDLWKDVAGLMGELSSGEQGLISGWNLAPLEDLPPAVHLTELERHCRNLQMEWLTGQIRLVSQQLRRDGLADAEMAQLLLRQREMMNARNRLTEAEAESSL